MGNLIYYLGQTCAFIAWIFFLSSYHAKRENKVIFLQIMSSIFYALDYLLLGSMSGLYISIFELIKSIGYYKSDKDKYIYLFTLPVYGLIVFLIGEFNILVAFAIIGSLIDGYVALKDTKTMVVGGAISNTLWVVHDLCFHDFVGGVTDAFLVLSNLSIIAKGFSKYIRKADVYTVINMPLSKSTINFIDKLDRLNYDEAYRWTKEEMEQLTKGDKHNYIFVKDKNQVIGYVNFLNLKEEIYNKMLESNEIYDSFTIDDIFKFNKKNRLYLNLNSVSVKNEYNNSDTIDKLARAIKRYIKTNKRHGYHIKNLCIFTVNDFERKVVEAAGFNLTKDISNECHLYELAVE